MWWYGVCAVLSGAMPYSPGFMSGTAGQTLVVFHILHRLYAQCRCGNVIER